MPTTYSSRHDGWRQEMNSALKESEQSSLYAGKKSKGIQSRVKHNVPSSKNDFASGFESRQSKTKRTSNGFVQQTEPSTRSNATSGREQGRSDKPNEKDSFSGNDFLKGFVQRSKSEPEPYGATKPLETYKQELLHNTTDQNKHLPSNTDTHYTKPFSTQTKRDGLVQRKTKPERKLDERGLGRSTDHIDSPQYARTPFASIQTPSPSTRYISTRASSTSSRSCTASQRKLDDQERLESVADHNRSSHYVREPLTVSIQTPSPTTENISTNESRKILSEAEWQELEGKSQYEQKEFLDKYEAEFKHELVSFSKKNVKRGDHIVCKGAFGDLYDHHLLCLDVDEDHISVIEYTGPSVGLVAISKSVATSNILGFAAIQKGTLSYDMLVKKKAKIRRWPKELERFPVHKVFERALERLRKNEQDYHAFDNNCEHFVTWCKCGLSTSLQVKPWFKPAWDGVKAVGSAAVDGLQRYGLSKGIPAFLKAVGNVSDELLGSISSPLSSVGFAVGGVIETGFAAWYIYQDYKRKKEGRLSESQFKINSVATASKAAFHIAGGITGSVMGSVAGPLGSFLGGAVGYGVGHVVGSAVGVCYEHAPTIKKAFQDKVIAPVKEVVKKCVDAIKMAGQSVWEEVKSVFSSLFSWW